MTIPYFTVTAPCETCGAVLTRTPYRLKKAKYGVFCNQKCFAKFRLDKLVGEWAPQYRKGFRNFNNKYVEVIAKWHPNAKKVTGYVALHRLILEAKLQRFLGPDEIVHHIDGDFRNNHWGNLVAMTQSEHARIHHNERTRTEDGRYV